MAASPLDNSDGPLGIAIKLDGGPMDDSLLVQGVRVRHALNRIPEALVVVKSDAVQLEDFGFLDSADAKLGTEIEIAGFYGDHDSETIFQGIVTAQRLRADAGGGVRMELTCRDKAIRLMEVRSSASYLAVKDSDVMSSIISDAGLSADVTATTSEAPLNLRVGATDWDFLRLLADRNGHVVLVKEAKVTSLPIDTGGSAVLTVAMGVDIVDLDITLDSQRMIGSASASAWNEASQAVVSGEAALPSDGRFGNTKISDIAAVTEDRVQTARTAREFEAADLGDYAKARTARASIAAIRGFVKFQGSGKIWPGDALEIKGTGDRFGGTGYVTTVEHELNAGVWSTTAHMGLQQDWITDSNGMAAPAAEALTAPIHGVQIGKVMKVAEDEEGKQRIQVSLPMIGDPPAEVWARYAAPYASNEAGIQFLPEVDDEVVVAFLSADPNAPIVIGSLHNAKAKRPVEETEDNYIKTITTREKLKVIFDDEKKILTLETPGGHKVTMDDDATSISLKDSNGNSIVMDASGIALKTDKDISITATGNITAEASSGDATVKGLNVTCEGQVGFTGKGGASAELSAGGTTTVKGALVNIN